MKKLTIWLFFLFLSNNSFGQDYREYQRTFNRIDEDILTQNYKLAIERLDSIYSNFKFIYAKHCVKALQICVIANDSSNADKWLSKCSLQGIPFWYIRNNELTQQSLKYSTTQKTLHNYDSLYSIYRATIDTDLVRIIDSLLTIDQKLTRKVNDGFFLFRVTIYWFQWRVNNKRQYKFLKKLIENHGYIGERLIGLDVFPEDSIKSSKHLIFYGPSEFREARVQIMLQHCFSIGHKIDLNFKNTLFHNLLNGNLPSFQYAIINDFMFNGKKEYINDNFLQPNKDNADKININRNTIGLNSLEQNKRNTLIERDRRKNKKSNSEIMLE